MIKYKNSANDITPQFLIFWKYYFLILKYYVIAEGLYNGYNYGLLKLLPSQPVSTRKRALKGLIILTYSIYIIICWSNFKHDMKIACYRHQTDRFDNFYDGVTPVNQELQPLFKPT